MFRSRKRHYCHQFLVLFDDDNLNRYNHSYFDNKLSNHSRFFSFLINPYPSFPFHLLSTQYLSLNISIIQKKSPSSQASLTVIPTHQCPINLFIHPYIHYSIVTNPLSSFKLTTSTATTIIISTMHYLTIPGSSRSLTILTNRFCFISSQLNPLNLMPISRYLNNQHKFPLLSSFPRHCLYPSMSCQPFHPSLHPF